MLWDLPQPSPARPAEAVVLANLHCRCGGRFAAVLVEARQAVPPLSSSVPIPPGIVIMPYSRPKLDAAGNVAPKDDWPHFDRRFALSGFVGSPSCAAYRETTEFDVGRPCCPASMGIMAPVLLPGTGQPIVFPSGA